MVVNISASQQFRRDLTRQKNIINSSKTYRDFQSLPPCEGGKIINLSRISSIDEYNKVFPEGSISRIASIQVITFEYLVEIDVTALEYQSGRASYNNMVTCFSRETRSLNGPEGKPVTSPCFESITAISIDLGNW